MRLDRGLRQRDLARELGVTPDTIRNYESGRSSPEVRLWPAILRFLGYDPRETRDGFPERLRRARVSRGMSQAELAALLGVQTATVGAWERGLHRPAGTARTAKALGRFLGGDP
jgi:transcriptional regulator with XRE-family HTH domain